MNNRKQTNKRGKNPRQKFTQVIIESETIKKDVNGVEIILPNPRFGTKKTVIHSSLKQALPL